MKFALEEHKMQFYQEIRDILDKVRDDILSMQTRRSVMKSLVRGVHTIKGSSGVFGFTELEEFSREFEGLLASLLNGTMSLDQELCGLVLQATDALNDMIDAYERGEVPCTDLALSEKFGEYLDQHRLCCDQEN